MRGIILKFYFISLLSSVYSIEDGDYYKDASAAAENHTEIDPSLKFDFPIKALIHIGLFV